MYLEWQMVVIWFPAVLMFSSVCLAYIFWPESFDAALSKTLSIPLLPFLPFTGLPLSMPSEA